MQFSAAFTVALSLSVAVPHRIAAENVTVTYYTVKPNVLHIYFDVSSHKSFL